MNLLTNKALKRIGKAFKAMSKTIRKIYLIVAIRSVRETVKSVSPGRSKH